jgi:hypothetical protein
LPKSSEPASGTQGSGEELSENHPQDIEIPINSGQTVTISDHSGIMQNLFLRRVTIQEFSKNRINPAQYRA